VRCWPRHFDIAIRVALEKGPAESVRKGHAETAREGHAEIAREGHAASARSIGIGVSPGDSYYAQPYLYVSPYPKPDTDNLPPLPPGGRWHTKDFFGAVATGIDLLALPDPRAGFNKIVDAAFEESLKRLGLV
jgi:hypothetical protein